MTGTRIQSIPVMGTIVTIEVVTNNDTADISAIDKAIERAFDWFREIEQLCNRFDPHSELSQLAAQAGVPVRVSAILYTSVEFALAGAKETAGAFDPTVGVDMEALGFNRDYRDGRVVRTGMVPDPDCPVSFRDVRVDPDERTITLHRPLVLDLGGVVKGLAIDMAARELAAWQHFVIDAGGDLFVGGHNARGEPWSVGIRHPRRDREVIELLRVSDVAVCTSGDYERTAENEVAGGRAESHIIDPRNHRPAQSLSSATVVAPTAMVADALATAAFVLGPDEGIRLLERHGVDGLLLSPTLDRFMTRGMHAALLPHA